MKVGIKMTFLKWALPLSCLIGNPILFAGDVDTSQDDPQQMKIENDRLKKALAEETKQIEQLKAEIAALKAQVAQINQVPGGGPNDPNDFIVDAIRSYSEKINVIVNSDKTELTKTTDWLGASKELDASLKKHRVLISCEIGDVTPGWNGKGTAVLRITSAIIKTSDKNREEIAFDSFCDVNIVTTAAGAEKIRKGSRLTLDGFMGLEVNFSAPLSRQPDLYYDQRDYPKGYIRLGTVKELWFDSPRYSSKLKVFLIMQNKCAVRVDGVEVKMPRG
jgi:hypothetical protein